MNNTKKPAHTIRIGNIEAAIWKNDSEKGNFYSVTFGRTAKVNGEYQTFHSYSPSDLPTIAKLADLALNWQLEQGA